MNRCSRGLFSAAGTAQHRHQDLPCSVLVRSSTPAFGLRPDGPLLQERVDPRCVEVALLLKLTVGFINDAGILAVSPVTY